MAGTNLDEPGHDRVKTATSFAPLTRPLYKPMNSLAEKGVFRFAKMARVDKVRILVVRIPEAIRRKEPPDFRAVPGLAESAIDGGPAAPASATQTAAVCIPYSGLMFSNFASRAYFAESR